MINITLPDGTKKQYDQPLDGLKIAESINKNLAKEAVAIKINGTLRDLQILIQKDCNIEIILKKSLEGLEIIRHDAAHVLAEAVQSILEIVPLPDPLKPSIVITGISFVIMLY
tara:strand:+ start:88 stop:426 length:339 start_codon:yes stop_codon:yes gene_type:complete